MGMRKNRLTRRHRLFFPALLVVTVPLGMSGLGCESLPGNEEQQGAAVGGVGGAAAGAALAEDNRAIGAIVGGLLGAGGGYLAGSQLDKNEEEAAQAAEQARQNPARPDAVAGTNTADLDNNGFVTMDELIAMKDAGLTGTEIINRAEATDQVFQLNNSQEADLTANGYDRATIDRLENVNRDVVERYERDRSARISRPS
jgi:hypothetical protein